MTKKVIGARIDLTLYNRLQKLGLSNSELISRSLRFYLNYHKQKPLTTVNKTVNNTFEENNEVPTVETRENGQGNHSRKDRNHRSSNTIDLTRYPIVSREINEFLQSLNQTSTWEPVSKKKKGSDD